jgi:hypothetical protein
MGLGSGIRVPGSGKNLFRIRGPGVKKAPDSQHWHSVYSMHPPLHSRPVNKEKPNLHPLPTPHSLTPIFVHPYANLMQSSLTSNTCFTYPSPVPMRKNDRQLSIIIFFCVVHGGGGLGVILA